MAGFPPELVLGDGLVWLAVLAFAFGVHHGFDADHLATIDSFVRGNSPRRPRVARFSGLLFSLGHGFVVIGVSTSAALLAGSWQLPSWLDHAGSLISITLLLILGSWNLHQVIHANSGEILRPAGLKSRLMPKAYNGGAGTVFFVGMLFAFSFDTLSQALLFSVVAKKHSGPWIALLLGSMFMAGMMVTDALNGVWTAWLLQRADRKAAMASRVMGAVIGVLSITFAMFGVLRLLDPAVAYYMSSIGFVTSLVVIALLLGGYFVATKIGNVKFE